MTQRVLICACGHTLARHSHGPGRPVSCGKVGCPCVRWRLVQTFDRVPVIRKVDQLVIKL